MKNNLALLRLCQENVDSDEWYTPPHIIQSLGEFDLDPAIGPLAPRTAAASYGPDVNGLTMPWFGRVWLNPPFSGAAPWIDRLREHGNGIALVFSRTDAKWFQQAVQAAGCMFAMHGRIAFSRPAHCEKSKARCPLGCVLIPFGAANVEAVRSCGLDGIFLKIARNFPRSKNRASKVKARQPA